MKRTFLSSLSIALMALFIPALTHTATAQNYQRHKINIGDFTHLVVKHAINVDYKSHPDSAGWATFTAPTELVNSIMFSNNGKGKVSVEVDTEKGQTTLLPTVTIYSNYLEKIENSADSTVRVMNLKTGPKFQAVLIGNGRLSLRDISTNTLKAKVLTGRGQLAISGSCTSANLSCTGVGAIQADNLDAEEVTATVNGTGTIGCSAKRSITYKGTGPGTVYYTGEPSEVKNRSISVKLKKL